MASLRATATPSLRLPPAAFPAKKPAPAGAIVRPHPVILRIPLAARAVSVNREAIRSQKYVYPDPIPEFAAAVSKVRSVFESLRSYFSR